MVRIVGNSLQKEKTRKLLKAAGTFAITGPTHLGKRSFVREVIRDFDDSDSFEASGSIVDARLVANFLRSRPLSGSSRVAVIDCCNGISDAAQDAYLKPCEEVCDSSVAFILRDERHLSDALLSRMRETIRWTPLSMDEMKDFIGEADDANGDVISACGGRPGLYEVMNRIDMSAIRAAILDRRAIERPVPSDIRNVKAGHSVERDAICAILMSTARDLIEAGNTSRAMKAMSLAHAIESVPSINVDVHWRRTWTVPDVI